MKMTNNSMCTSVFSTGDPSLVQSTNTNQVCKNLNTFMQQRFDKTDVSAAQLTCLHQGCITESISYIQHICKCKDLPRLCDLRKFEHNKQGDTKIVIQCCAKGRRGRQRRWREEFF